MKRFSVVSFALVLAVALVPPASFADDKKNDPDAIGDRDVGKGVNFYSLEKEIAIGKRLAQEVERQAKMVDDPVVAEYVNRLGQNLVRNSDQGSIHDQGGGFRRGQRLRPARRILF